MSLGPMFEHLTGPDLILPGEARRLPCSKRTMVMGILNTTPDSFFDGGAFVEPNVARDHALCMHEDGADIIDIGGESTRPGSAAVPPEEQVRRTVAVITAIRKKSMVPISIDTTSSLVARAALDAGADVINDISALRADLEMGPLAATRKVPVILMHMQGKPGTMQDRPTYENVVEEVATFLEQRKQVAIAYGVKTEAIVLDPGFGFGKKPADNLTLLANMSRFCGQGCQVLAGFSRKSTIGTILDLPVEERLEGSLASAVIAVLGGARLIRVHDVKETVRTVRMTEAIMTADSFRKNNNI